MTKIYLMVFLLLIFLVNNSYAGEIVNITETYTYEIMNSNIKELQEKYPDLLSYHSIDSYAGETNVSVDNFPDILKRNRSAGLLIAEKIIELK